MIATGIISWGIAIKSAVDNVHLWGDAWDFVVGSVKQKFNDFIDFVWSGIDSLPSPRFYYAQADLYVDVYARAFVSGDTALTGRDSMKDVNDFLDDTAKSIIETLQPIEKSAGPYNGLVKRFVLRSMSNNLSEKGESDRGTMRITWRVEFAVCFTYGGPVDNFVKAENTLKMGSGEKDKMEFDTVVQVVPPAPPTPEPEEPAEGEPELEEPENDES